MIRRMRRCPPHHLFHIEHGTKYYVEDSYRGVMWAIRRHFGWIDLDIQKTKDDVLIVAHGPRPLSDRATGSFYDPQGRISPAQTFEQLTWEQVQRLRSRDHSGYRIMRADHLIPIAVGRGIKVEAEAKTPHIKVDEWLGVINRCKVANPRAKVWCKGFRQFRPSLESAAKAQMTVFVLLHSKADAAAITGTWNLFCRYYRGFKPHRAAG